MVIIIGYVFWIGIVIEFIIIQYDLILKRYGVVLKIL